MDRSRSRKRYDRAYFDRWYRRQGIGAPADVARAARFVLATTEHLLMRPVRTVVDIGCGEGAWRAPLLAARPSARYVGIDPSEYAVTRYGRTRNLYLGSLGALDEVDAPVPARVDLVICADVLPYVDDAAIDRGVRWIAERLDGLAHLHAMTVTDAFEGDRSGFHARTAEEYERAFAAHGLRRVGPHLYAGEALLPTLAALEGPTAGPGGPHAPRDLQ